MKDKIVLSIENAMAKTFEELPVPLQDLVIRRLINDAAQEILKTKIVVNFNGIFCEHLTNTLRSFLLERF